MTAVAVTSNIFHPLVRWLPARGPPPPSSSGQDRARLPQHLLLIGVRYRQALAELRMDLAEGAGAVEECLTIAGGTEQILLTLAAERLLGLPR